MSSSEDIYAGMTMNERLCASGRMAEFDRAVFWRDRATIVAIYKELAPTTDPEWAADSILRGPLDRAIAGVRSWLCGNKQ